MSNDLEQTLRALRSRLVHHPDACADSMELYLEIEKALRRPNTDTDNRGLSELAAREHLITSSTITPSTITSITWRKEP